MATTAQTIIDGAFDVIGVKQTGEPMSATDNADALRRLNNFVKILNNQALISAFVGREVWPLTSNKALYTIGPGGDFDTTRPFTLEAAALLQNPDISTAFTITAVSTTADTFTVAGDQTAFFTSGSIAVVSGSTGNDGNYTVVSSVFGAATVITVADAVPSATVDGTIQGFVSDLSTVEIPLTIYTDDAWSAVQVKGLASAQPTGVFFEANYARDLATIQLWPIPNIATNSLVLYRRNTLATFADLATTSYSVPPGFEELLEYGLAMRLGTPWSVANPEVKNDVRFFYFSAMAIVKRTNNKPTDMPVDPAWTGDKRGYYNIQTSNM